MEIVHHSSLFQKAGPKRACVDLGAARRSQSDAALTFSDLVVQQKDGEQKLEKLLLDN